MSHHGMTHRFRPSPHIVPTLRVSVKDDFGRLASCVKLARMKRVLVLVCFLFVQFDTLALGAPLQEDCSGVVISSPSSGDAVRGRISIVGSAFIPQFQFYKVELAAGAAAPDSAFRNLAGDVHRSAVQSGVLEGWDTTGVPDGTYSLRLTVVDIRGNFPCTPATVRVVVANRAPTNTPTPSATDTPTPSATGSPSPQASSAATRPAAPTIDLPTSAARSTDAITTTTGVSTTNTSGARNLLNLDYLPSMGQACVLGALISAAVFVLYAVFAVARWVIDNV